MVTYPITRFLVEYLRNDEGAFFAGMTISQNISVVLFAAGLRLLGLALQAAQGAVPRPARSSRCHEPRCWRRPRTEETVPLRRPSGPEGRGVASGNRDVVEDALKDVVGAEALGIGLEADQDPVAHDVAGQALDVVRRDEVAAGEQGVAA